MENERLKNLKDKLVKQFWVRFLASLFVFSLYFVIWRFGFFSFNIFAFSLVCLFEGVINQPYRFIVDRFHKVRTLQKYLYLHILLDILVISIVILILGPTDFFLFSAAYYLVIIYAGILLRKKDCYNVAFLSSLALGLVLYFNYIGMLPRLKITEMELVSLRYLAIWLGSGLFLFFVAYLSGFSKELLEEEESKLMLERQLSEARAEMVDIVSHEMRDPINSISGFLKLILDNKMGELLPQVRKYLELAYSQGRMLMKLVDNLLDVSMLEAGQVELHKKSINIKSLIDEVLEAKKAGIDEQKLRVMVNIDSAVGEIQADPELLYRLFSNLIGNAVKYNNTEGDLIIKAVKEENMLQLSVKDTGVGILSEDLDKIFHKFYKAHGAKPTVKGNGLGLAICREIVTLFGGSIKVVSLGVGTGSEFIVRLPLGKS
ncbi:MAG: HAMP domain-containing sensor histidine kinase [Candidatus Saganbacteria bacterium]|nr:HAMP domain-containing sensor histidine kinase [Candidatus Saganbacteria bacterium]